MLSEGCFFFVVGLLQDCEQAPPKSVVRFRDVNRRVNRRQPCCGVQFRIFGVSCQASWMWTGFTFQGIEDARPVPGILEAIQSADLVVVCPSNPWVSISPILGIQGIRDALVAKKNVVAVSPLIGGQALKGPAAKMYKELGWEPAALSVADQYKDFITMFLLDSADVADCEEIRQWGIIPYVSDIIMKDIPGRIRLAELILNLASQQQGGTQPS